MNDWGKKGKSTKLYSNVNFVMLANILKPVPFKDGILHSFNV